MCILILPTLAWWGLSFCPSILESIDISDHDENREKATISIPINLDNITEELEAYYNDRIPFRNPIITSEHRSNARFDNFYQANIEPHLITYFAPKDIVLTTASAATPDVDLNELLPKEEKALPKQTIIRSPKLDALASESENDNPEEHNFYEVERLEPNCIEDGYIKYKCQDEDCEKTKNEILPALGHSFKVIDHVDASYQSYGHSIYRCEKCGSSYCDDIVNKLIDDAYLPPKEAENQVILGRFNWLFYAGNNALDYYQGTNILSSEQMAKQLAKMQELQSICEDKGIQLAFLVLPNREQVYPEYMPNYNIENIEKRETVLAKYIAANSDITFLYPLNELLAAKVYCEPCFPYDTHWNQAGAFTGVQALYKAIGIPTTNILNLDIKTTNVTPRGLVATGALDPSLYTGDFDYIINYRPDIKVLETDGIDGFLTPTNTFRAKSSNNNGKKFVLVGDSFRVAMIPYLEKDFSEICISHRQDLENITQDINEANVLVLESVERFDNEMFLSITKIIDILK